MGAKRIHPSGHQKRLERKAAGRWTEEDERREVERQRAKSVASYQKRCEYIDGIKLSRGCADCGYRGHPAALDFDHLPGCVKESTLSSLRRSNRRMDLIMREIDKCEVVCANCHRIRTAERRKKAVA